MIVVPLETEPDGSLGPACLDEVSQRLRAARPHAVVAGPGLGSTPGVRSLVQELLERGLGAEEPPAVLLDADALNVLAGQIDVLDRAARAMPLAVTPHPGELGRLLGLSAEEVDRDRLEVARRAARRTGAPVLLKGVPTVVCSPAGETVLNLTGNAGLARGGTGDLLSGIAGAFLTKRMDVLAALALAAFVHGLAADSARARLGTLGMTASDVATALPRVLRAIECGDLPRVWQRLRPEYASVAVGTGGENRGPHA
ncbi:MAG: NAD(P)H-hydrate dehydratase [Gemmatimonadetes bacterium]|nr:NAD(P)H-hydrate dehydratase [Gemmatimonadota bacterium]